MGSDLSKDPVFLKKRSDDHLGKEALIHGVDGFPGEFQFERAGFLELDGDHKAFAADFRDDVVFFLEVAEPGHQLFSSEGGIFDEVLVFCDMKAGQSASHSEIVATEGGGVSDTTIKARENALVNRATHDDGGAGDIAAGQGFSHGDDVGIKVPVLEAEPFAGSA